MKYINLKYIFYLSLLLIGCKSSDFKNSKIIESGNENIEKSKCSICTEYFSAIDFNSLPYEYFFYPKYRDKVECNLSSFVKCLTENGISSNESILYLDISKKYLESIDSLNSFKLERIYYFLENSDIISQTTVENQFQYYKYLSKYKGRLENKWTSIQGVLFSRLDNLIYMINGEAPHIYYQRSYENNPKFTSVKTISENYYENESTILLNIVLEAYEDGLIELKAFGEE